MKSIKRNYFISIFKEALMYGDLLKIFFLKDFKANFKQTILGPIWFLIQPIFSTLIFSILFGKVAGLSTDQIPKPLYYFSGIILFNLFTELVNKNAIIFRDFKDIFSKIYFPRIIAVLSVTFNVFLRFTIQLALLFLMILIYSINGINIKLSLLFIALPIFILLIVFIGIGFGLIIACYTIKYKDIQLLLTYFLQFFIYTTTVIIPFSAIPNKYKILVLINPISNLIESFRHSLFGIGNFTFLSFGYTLFISVSFFLIGIYLFNEKQKTFLDNI
jgi:lipopolysaccharide transport system permease protein